MVNRDRYSNNFSATLTCAAVSGDGDHSRSVPTLTTICGDAANPTRRIFTGQIGGFIQITATSRAKISFVSADARIPRFSIESIAALLATQLQRLYPFWIGSSANIFRLEPSRIIFCRFAYAIHALSILRPKTATRAKPFARHSARRHQHGRSAFLTWFLLSHVSAHGKIITHFGSGTTGQVAQLLGRQWIGCEINESYKPLQDRRTAQTGMVFA